ncbi:MAG: hypothetical protein KAT48_14595 [Bacteroidales bacterium]|nr:hypothetical protein [Bacteroidales bacterium]
MYLPEKENIKITVRDIVGKELAQYENRLNWGQPFLYFLSKTIRVG